jgi:hypothetical protein
LIRFVERLPPAHARVRVLLAPSGTDAYEFGKLRVAPRTVESGERKNHEEGEGYRGVAPRAAKRLRKVAQEKLAYARAAFHRLRAIDAPVRADDETVEIIDKARVARFGARNRQIGRRATIDASEFAHLFAVQAT